MTDVFNLVRLISNIENGTKFMHLGDVSIEQIKPQPSKNNLKIAIVFVLSLFASIAWVLVRQALAQRQKT
jgi:hypothetical protein